MCACAACKCRLLSSWRPSLSGCRKVLAQRSHRRDRERWLRWIENTPWWTPALTGWASKVRYTNLIHLRKVRQIRRSRLIFLQSWSTDYLGLPITSMLKSEHCWFKLCRSERRLMILTGCFEFMAFNAIVKIARPSAVSMPMLPSRFAIMENLGPACIPPVE